MVLGGSFDMKYIVYAFIAISMALIYSNKYRNTGEFIIGLCFMLLGLTTLKDNADGMHLDQNQSVIDFFSSINNWGYGSYLLFLVVGGLLTCAVQSSAAIMAITMTLCTSGVLPIDLGIALVMGENVGTTITSNIVALSASTQARRAALAHLVFNLFGVIWVLCIFPYFVGLICSLWDVNYVPEEMGNGVDKEKLSAVLATFHTGFNVLNTLILIWFIKPLEKFVCLIIKNKDNQDDDETRLTYISGGLMSTAELSILEAKKEIVLFSQRTNKMFGFVQDLLHEEKTDSFNKLFSRIEKYEQISDNMELEIGDYLNKVSEGRLSVESKTDIQQMLREVTEIESIGDSCYNIARTLNRKRKHSQEDFTEKQYEHIHSMMNLVNDSLGQMTVAVSHNSNQYFDYNKSFNIENEINNYRNQLKNQNINDIDNHAYSYQLGVYYMDVITECEKLADYVLNVVEAVVLVKKKNA